MNKLLLLAILAAVCVAISARPNEGERKLVGGVQKLEGDDLKEAEEALQSSLKKLAVGEKGPHYKLGKINSASKQVVSGFLYKFDADIIDTDDEEKTKNCRIKIWSQPWLDNGIQVTFEFKDEPEKVFQHSA